jgi:hypothetical protein
MQRVLLRRNMDGNEVASVEIAAVDAERIDLGRAVGPDHVAAGRVTGAPDTRRDHVALKRAPLALHAENPGPEVEGEVIAPVLGNRLQDGNAECDGLGCDLCFSDGALVVGRVHEHMFARPLSRNKAEM